MSGKLDSLVLIDEMCATKLYQIIFDFRSVTILLAPLVVNL